MNYSPGHAVPQDRNPTYFSSSASVTALAGFGNDTLMITVPANTVHVITAIDMIISFAGGAVIGDLGLASIRQDPTAFPGRIIFGVQRNGASNSEINRIHIPCWHLVFGAERISNHVDASNSAFDVTCLIQVSGFNYQSLA